MQIAQPIWLIVGAAVCGLVVWRYRRSDRRQGTPPEQFAPAPGTVWNDLAAHEPTAVRGGRAPGHGASDSATGSLRPWFIKGIAALVAAVAFGGIIRAILARRANDPKRLGRLARKKALNERLAAMDEALDKEAAPLFFHSARRALQERTAGEWRVPADRGTTPEVESRPGGDGEKICAVFQTADEIARLRKPISAPELRR